MEKIKPRLAVSKCLEFEHCRYNGNIISSDVVKMLRTHVEFFPVCPEVEIGLGIPREPIRLVGDEQTSRLLQPSTSKDLTSEMQKFAEKFLSSLPEIDGFILKSSSPSCGPSQVKLFPSIEKVSALSKKGIGHFAQAVIEKFPEIVIEDEGRLTNFTLRENFFTRIFATAAFRNTTATGKMRDLVDFHSKYKLLLLAHDEKKMRELGKLVANEAGRPTSEIIEDYRAILMNTFANPPSEGEHVNVLQHAFGYFKNQLSKEEKSYFLDVLDNYRQGKIPLSVPIGIVNSYIIRFGEPYLAQQTYFTPYPLDLVSISDSGKGRDL